MKKLFIAACFLLGVSLASTTFSMSPSFLITSPEATDTLTGAITLGTLWEPQAGTGILDCDLKLRANAKRSVFSTGIVLPLASTGHVFSVDTRSLPMKKNNYTFACKLYSLSGNTLLGTDAVKFRMNPPPPVVIFAGQKGNLIPNPFFLEKSGELPLSWKRGGFGRTDYTQDYLLKGLVSSRSLRTTITRYISGDVKWYFQDVPVTPGMTYIYSQKYHATVPAQLTVRYTLKSGKQIYDELKVLPVTEGEYASVRVYFIPPKDSISLTVWSALSTEGSIVIDDVSLIESN